MRYNVHVGLTWFVKLARVTIIANTNRGLPAVMIAIIITAASCGGTVIFAHWFPVVLRGCFRIPPRPSSRASAVSERRESSRKRRSQRFLWRTVVPHPLSPSDLCRSIRRLTKQVVTGTADPCISLSTSHSAATRKRGNVYLAGGRSRQKVRLSFLSYPAPLQPPNLVVKTPSRAHVTSRNLSCFRSSS